MADPVYVHLYWCSECEAEVEVEHRDEFVYIDDCPHCGSDLLQGIDIIMEPSDD